MNKLSLLKIVLFLLIVFGLLIFFAVGDLDFGGLLEDFKGMNEDHTIQITIFFILLLSLASLTFIPIIPIVLALGYFFDVYTGLLISISGVTLSSTLFFLLARFLGRNFAENLAEGRVNLIKHYNKKIEKNGFLIIILLRMVPLVPFLIVNLALGISRIRFRDFFLATLMGTLPGTYLLLQTGGHLNDLGDSKLYIFGSTYVIFLSISIWLAWRYRVIKGEYGTK